MLNRAGEGRLRLFKERTHVIHVCLVRSTEDERIYAACQQRCRTASEDGRQAEASWPPLLVGCGTGWWPGEAGLLQRCPATAPDAADALPLRGLEVSVLRGATSALGGGGPPPVQHRTSPLRPVVKEQLP